MLSDVNEKYQSSDLDHNETENEYDNDLNIQSSKVLENKSKV